MFTFSTPRGGGASDPILGKWEKLPRSYFTTNKPFLVMASAGHENIMTRTTYMDFEDDYGHQCVERDILNNTIMNLFRSFLPICASPKWK